MKTAIIVFALLFCACVQSVDPESEKATINKLIDDETRYAASADSVNWQKCWSNTNEDIFTMTGANGTGRGTGWNEVRKGMNKTPFKLQLKRSNYQYTIGKDVAFVNFDQEANWGGGAMNKTRESRTLRKINGEWKIVQINVIDLSSYEKSKTASFHLAKEKIAVDPKTSLRTQPGLGGMYVGFVEVPAGTDFSPFFTGLPHDMCSSPHWGYVFEGAIRIKYADGKEETVNKGEVFYWPAPHTGIIEKDAKFIDFSPESELTVVLNNMAEKMAALHGQGGSDR
jgi:hypothetical protein